MAALWRKKGWREQEQYHTIPVNRIGRIIDTMLDTVSRTDLPKPRTRTEQVMDLVRQRIERRMLVPGARLPSVRAMAESSGFSKSTIVEAYDRLAAEGVIRARAGAGFYVSSPLAPLALCETEAMEERDIDPVWLLRQCSDDREGVINAGSGTLPQDWLAQESMRKALRGAARELPSGVMSDFLGYEPMRMLLSRRMAEQGVEASPDQILLTDSGTQALDLVCRFLLQPGDTVLLDDPCFFNFVALLRAHRVRAVSVPMTPQGPDLAAFAQVVQRERPRLYITNSAVHNPTGATLSATHVHRVLKIAAEADMVIVEDDIFADFELETSPRYASFDGLERVIRIGSLSKTASTAIRCGHIALRPDWVMPLADLRVVTAYMGNPLGAQLLVTMLTDGTYRHHMETLRRRLARARAKVGARLTGLGLRLWCEPQAGMSLWAQLPDGMDAAALARAAAREQIVLAPGVVFSPSGGWQDYLRINAVHGDNERFFAFLAKACALPKG
jgi:DNA-binding transcriptional MocR family regulator